MAKYDNNDYHCACAVGYAGKYCEIGIYINCQISDTLIGCFTFLKDPIVKFRSASRPLKREKCQSFCFI